MYSWRCTSMEILQAQYSDLSYYSAIRKHFISAILMLPSEWQVDFQYYRSLKHIQNLSTTQQVPCHSPTCSQSILKIPLTHTYTQYDTPSSLYTPSLLPRRQRPLNSPGKVMLIIQDTAYMSLWSHNFLRPARLLSSMLSFLPAHNARTLITALHHLCVYTPASPLDSRVLETKNPTF